MFPVHAPAAEVLLALSEPFGKSGYNRLDLAMTTDDTCEKNGHVFCTSADALLREHGLLLRSLIGQRLECSWVAWQTEDDEWFNDEPVILRIGGRNVELVLTELSSAWVGVNTIDVESAPNWFDCWEDYPLAWRKNAHPVLAGASEHIVVGVEVVEYLFKTRPVDGSGPETAAWVLSGLGFDLANGGYVDLFNALDEHGLSNERNESADFRRTALSRLPTWGETVRVAPSAPAHAGKTAAVCGMRDAESEEQRAEFGCDVGERLYLVEFGDGSAVEVSARHLVADSPARADNAHRLTYAEDGFPVKARRLVSAGESLCFEVDGPAYEALSPHLDTGLSDPAKLGLIPRLQPLLGIAMLARGLGRELSFERNANSVTVWIGPAAH